MSRWETRRKERARVYTERIGDENKLSPDFAGVLCCSPLQTVRAWVYISMEMRIGIATNYHQILRAQCSAPRIASLQTTSAAQHRQRGDYARLGLVTLPRGWNATILLLAIRCANQDFFDFSAFSILNPRASYPLKSTDSLLS